MVRTTRRLAVGWLLVSALLAACSGTEEIGPKPASATAGATAAPPTCDGETVAAAPRISGEQAESLRGRTVTICDASQGTDGSQAFNVSKVQAARIGDHDFVSLIAFDGGPVPSGCSISLSSRLFVLLDDEWVEGRQVGCDG